MRKSIKNDLLFFAIPAVIVFAAGLFVNFRHLAMQYGTLYVFTTQSTIGLALIIIGLINNLVAQFALKRFYSATLKIRENHQLITHGVYGFVRHPIYLGVIIAILGISMYCSSLYGFLILSGLIPIILNRIRMEEKMLTDEFGDVYRAYKETTRKLIPFIY